MMRKYESSIAFLFIFLFFSQNYCIFATKSNTFKQMKVVHSSFFRALCAIVVGALLIKYREETVTWITIAIGVMFFLSGVVSLVTYYGSKRQASKQPIVYDADGKQITGLRPNFPIVGVGSLLLGVILALMPTTFVTSLVYILAFILILGAISQLLNLASVNKIGHVGIFFWIIPILILLFGIMAIAKPSTIASAPLLFIGYTMVIYGVIECVNTFKMMNEKRKWQKAEVLSSTLHTSETTVDAEEVNE